MTTDRELLELAAKAAGVDIHKSLGTGAWVVGLNGKTYFKTWNPLTNDGHALRLAVKLQLTVCNEHLSAGSAYCTGPEDAVFQEIMSGRIGIDNEVIQDDYAATRRAITVAAAEIGKATPIHACQLCGEPMPAGETMFKYHGYSGPCPKPPLKKVEFDVAGNPKLELTVLEREAINALNTLAALPDEVLTVIPVELRMRVDAVLAMASVRRVGVQ